MRFPPIPVLETPRLRLRKLTMDDAQTYYRRLGSSSAVTRYMLWEPHQSISESVASIQKALQRYKAGRCYRWGIAEKESDSLIGVIELLRFDEITDSCSFAYMLAEDFWGFGYGTEALKAAFGFAFTQMQIRTITADHFAENVASGRVMEKAGMQKVCVLPGKYEKNGKTCDAIAYRITQTHWAKNNRTES